MSITVTQTVCDVCGDTPVAFTKGDMPVASSFCSRCVTRMVGEEEGLAEAGMYTLALAVRQFELGGVTDDRIRAGLEAILADTVYRWAEGQHSLEGVRELLGLRGELLKAYAPIQEVA